MSTKLFLKKQCLENMVYEIFYPLSQFPKAWTTVGVLKLISQGAAESTDNPLVSEVFLDQPTVLFLKLSTLHIEQVERCKFVDNLQCAFYIKFTCSTHNSFWPRIHHAFLKSEETTFERN